MLRNSDQANGRIAKAIDIEMRALAIPVNHKPRMVGEHLGWGPNTDVGTWILANKVAALMHSYRPDALNSIGTIIDPTSASATEHRMKTSNRR